MDRTMAWLQPRSELESIYDDVEPHRRQTPAQRVAESIALSRYALRFLDRLAPDARRRQLWHQDELAPEHRSAWDRLLRAKHGG